MRILPDFVPTFMSNLRKKQLTGLKDYNVNIIISELIFEFLSS